MPRNSRNDSLKDQPFAHILVEGIDDIKIFNDKRNKDRYKNNITKFSKKYNQTVLAYLVMDNLAHIIFKIDDIESLSTCIKCINLSYSQNYNKNHKRNGVVFKSRYKSEPLSNEKELINCIAFIHNKPVELKKVVFAEDYIHSSSNDYALKNSTIIDFDFVKQIFGTIPTIPNGTNFKFLDSKADIGENIETVLKEIVDRYNIQSVDSLKNNMLLYLICKELKGRTQCSLREIALRLNVSREKVRRLMKIQF